MERRGGGEMWWRGEVEVRCGERRGSCDVVERRGGVETLWRGEGEVRCGGEERGR